jgi:hypothetical protein
MDPPRNYISSPAVNQKSVVMEEREWELCSITGILIYWNVFFSFKLLFRRVLLHIAVEFPRIIVMNRDLGVLCQCVHAWRDCDKVASVFPRAAGDDVLPKSQRTSQWLRHIAANCLSWTLYVIVPVILWTKRLMSDGKGNLSCGVKYYRIAALFPYSFLFQ